MKMAIRRQLEAQALLGDGKACLALYQEYNNTPDLQTARKWLDRALDCDEPTAQFLEGVQALLLGETLHGIQFLKLAAVNKSSEAMNVLGQYYLGNIYGLSSSVIDLDQGLDYLFQAASAGNVDAQIILGKSYHTGKWVRKNLFFSRYWLEKAVSQNSRLARRLLDSLELIPNTLN